MTWVQAYFELLGVGLAIAGLVHGRLARVLRPVPGILVSVVVGVGAAWVPIGGGLGLWQWVLSIIDHVSVAAFVMIGVVMLRRAGLLRRDEIQLEPAGVFVVCYGLVLYASGLGFLPVDIYDFGYGIGPLYWAAVAAVIVAAVFGMASIVIVIVAGLAAHLGGFYESGNLHDSLIDPVLFITLLAIPFAQVARGLRRPRSM